MSLSKNLTINPGKNLYKLIEKADNGYEYKALNLSDNSVRHITVDKITALQFEDLLKLQMNDTVQGQIIENILKDQAIYKHVTNPNLNLFNPDQANPDGDAQHTNPEKEQAPTYIPSIAGETHKETMSEPDDMVVKHAHKYDLRPRTTKRTLNFN